MPFIKLRPAQRLAVALIVLGKLAGLTTVVLVLVQSPGAAVGLVAYAALIALCILVAFIDRMQHRS